MPGISHPRAKLTIAQVKAIRQDRRFAWIIGEENGVTAVTVNRIRRGEGWKLGQ
jgi:hypothetical protein